MKKILAALLATTIMALSSVGVSAQSGEITASRSTMNSRGNIVQVVVVADAATHTKADLQKLLENYSPDEPMMYGDFRASCSHDYVADATLYTHEMSSPTCTIWKQVYYECSKCGAGRKSAKIKSGSHSYGSSACINFG